MKKKLSPLRVTDLNVGAGKLSRDEKLFGCNPAFSSVESVIPVLPAISYGTECQTAIFSVRAALSRKCL